MLSDMGPLVINPVGPEECHFQRDTKFEKGMKK